MLLSPYCLTPEWKQTVISSQEAKQAMKSKAGEVKYCKEKIITSLPNEWYNIPLHLR